MKKIGSVSIVATLGPASDDIDTIRRLVIAGADIIRINMSHGSRSDYEQRILDTKKVAQELSRPVPVMVDLTGPRLRLGVIDEDERKISVGEIIKIGVRPESSSNGGLCIPHPEILSALSEGNRILLNDGRVELIVKETVDDIVYAEALIGGKVSSRKGVTIPGVNLPISALTQKDKEDIEFACSLGCDVVTVNFVQDETDIIEAKELIQGRSKVFAQIQRSVALQNFSNILRESDGVVLSRGYLAVELPFQSLPGTMRRLTQEGRLSGKPTMVATQVLESMISDSQPTSAEISYAAAPIYDGANMIMLSAETAAGDYPVESVSVLKALVSELEKDISRSKNPNADINSDELIDARIAFLSGNPALTRVTAQKYAEQIDGELRGITAIKGYKLPDALEVMSEFSIKLRQISTFSNDLFEPLEETKLRQRVGYLEQLLERLKKALEDEKKAKEALEVLAKKDGFWGSYKKSAGTAAGVATVGIFSIGVPSAAIYFLGADHPIVQSVLTTIGKLPK